MPSKKEKVEKLSASAQEDLVLKYLKQQNRPYSATDISANLHNQVTKNNAQKILTKLHEAKKIVGRFSGKQSVYHAIQDPEDSTTPEELAEMDAQIQKTRDETEALVVQIRSLRAELAQLNSSLSNADLQAQIAEMEAEKTDIEGRLAALRSGNAKPVSREERARVDAELKMLEKCRVAREKIVRDMWDLVSDMVPKEEWEELKEDFGIEI
ncbi:uncharacterized protein PV09_05956 [Verruconis gallopava]|uniref:Homologous-pairing protein 2 winged helix domain-containing protein n=1 Tax=Verruconis gallopava TaxID=253628 RepID=A0A0D2A825_9PEZI|nr:uncharacterized protein PV09_05956 [Verruconis gallopava]KIW02908.1 hypothetical protein PV09_05956 [Verruconis gallopava]